MRFGAFVITFNRPEVLRRTIEAIRAQTRPPETIVVVDNGSDPLTRAVVEGFTDGGVEYLPMGHNGGPAGGAAAGLRRLFDDGFDAIYWGDDDDPPRYEDDFERLLAIPGRAGGSDVAAVATVGVRWDWKRGEFVRLRDEQLHGVLDVDVCGGGQQLIVFRRAMEAVGFPNPDLFFSFEDLDYCLRLRAAGFRILVDGEVMAQRRRATGRLGIASTKSFVPKRSLQSMWRSYYSTRNYIYLMRHEFDEPWLPWREAGKALARSALAWTRGARYGAAFTGLAFRAVLDGYRGHLGCTVPPRAKYPTTP